jgi:tetratricopeptide (TPR) repeat protein
MALTPRFWGDNHVLADEYEPSAVDQDVRAAAAAYRAGKFDEVEALCSRILKRYPDDVSSLQLLAAAAAQRRDPRRGVELMERVISLRPDSVDGYIQLAKIQRLERLVSEPIAALKKAIELKPESGGPHNDLGLIYLEEFDPAEALDCFDQAIYLSPDLTVAHFNKGVALELQGIRAEAIASFRRVVEIDPNFAEAHVRLGDALLFEGDRAEAIECYRRAAAARPGSILALTSEAKILMEERKEGAAAELMRQRIGLHPHNSNAHGLLGTILMRLGRFHDAAAHFDLSLALNRRQTAAYHALVHVKKLAAADRPLLARMEWMLGEHRLADDERAQLHFALGKAYDDLGEYDNAIQHFDLGNRLKRQHMSFDQALYARIVDGAIARFTADFFSRNEALGSDWEAPILILGMPRSGTTLVEQIVSSHPETAAGGELTFWGERAAGFRANAAGQIDPAWVRETAHDYRALLAGISSTARYVTDKRPHNFLFLGLIHAVFPRARVIHCRRHPIDTCLSIYFQNFASRMDFAYDRDDLVPCYRHYLRLMAHWRNVLPADRFLEIQYEGLVADRQAETRKLIDFCELDWNDACLRSEHNPRAVQTASVWQARQPVYQTSVARWRHYEPWLGVLRELLADADPQLS